MERETMEDDKIKTTKEGRYYIETSDFFKSNKVRLIINKILESSIYKDINQKKERCYGKRD